MLHWLPVKYRINLQARWWCYDIKTLSQLLALCEGSPPVVDGLRSGSHKDPILRCFDVSFFIRLIAQTFCMTKRWFEAPWRSCYVTAIGFHRCGLILCAYVCMFVFSVYMRFRCGGCWGFSSWKVENWIHFGAVITRRDLKAQCTTVTNELYTQISAHKDFPNDQPHWQPIWVSLESILEKIDQVIVELYCIDFQCKNRIDICKHYKNSLCVICIMNMVW